MSGLRPKASALVKKLVGDLFRRDIVVLQRSQLAIHSNGLAVGELLPVHYTYRASDDGFVTYTMLLDGTDFHYQLFNMAFAARKPIAGSRCFSVAAPRVQSGDVLRISLLEPTAWLNEMPLECQSGSRERSRKFIAHLRITEGSKFHGRSCSHYLPFAQKPVGKDYYFGDDYVDYPLHTNVAYALQLVSRYASRGRLLDIGCALGIYTKAFLDAHYDAYGMDVSEFAIAEAAQRVGADRVRVCNLDARDIPFEGAFDILWMWDVLEHFAEPWIALQKATSKVGQGAWLFLHTSNADSLAHRIYEQDWEGYTDYSHHGVDKVSATSLKTSLIELGWDIVHWKCDSFWGEGVDPVVLRLKQLVGQIPELQTLLLERDLGDNLLVVARKR